MKPILLAALLFLIPALAPAEQVAMLQPIVNDSTQGAPPAFAGPCDQGVTCTDGWGAERLTSAYTGKLVNAINTGNSTTGDIGYDTNGGLLAADLTSLGCTTNTSCRVVTFYSQFGGCDMTQASGSNQAFLHVTTTENGHATVIFDGTIADSYVCTTGSTYTSATMISMVTPNTNVTSPGTCGLFGGGTQLGWWVMSVLDNASECVFAQGNYGGGSTIDLAIVGDSGAAGHNDSGLTRPAGLYCFISQHSASNVQIIENGTASTAGNPGSVLGNGPHKHAVGSDRTISEGWSGEANVFIFINPAVNNTNAGTVAHKMAQFWQASPTC